MSCCERRALLLPRRSCSPRLQAGWEEMVVGAQKCLPFSSLPTSSQLTARQATTSSTCAENESSSSRVSSLFSLLFLLCLNNARANGKIRISSEKSHIFSVLKHNNDDYGCRMTLFSHSPSRKKKLRPTPEPKNCRQQRAAEETFSRFRCSLFEIHKKMYSTYNTATTTSQHTRRQQQQREKKKLIRHNNKAGRWLLLGWEKSDWSEAVKVDVKIKELSACARSPSFTFRVVEALFSLSSINAMTIMKKKGDDDERRKVEWVAARRRRKKFIHLTPFIAI